MKIIALRAENFKRLVSVAIKPDGSLVRLIGRNGQGKSSCLDAIAAAIGGRDLSPEVPIRRGEDRAEVTVDLGDFIVTRTWTAAGGSSLTIRSPEGLKYPSPQSMLDKLIGKLSFDPLAFMNARPADQVDTLRKLVGLDFTKLEMKRAGLYEDRTLVNREVAQLEGSLAQMPQAEAPPEPVNLADLLKEQDSLLEQRRLIEGMERAAARASMDAKAQEDGMNRAYDRVVDLERQLEEARGKLAGWQQAATAAKAKADEAEKAFQAAGAPPPLDGIRQRLAEAESTNAKVRANKARIAAALQLAARREASKELSRAIDLLDAEKTAALEAAQFPVPGLSFNDSGVTLNGLPIKQASSAEELRVSLAIGAALNNKLAVIFVRDGSLLDEQSLTLVAEMAEKMNLQVWMERVAGKGETGIVIEDGMVDGVPAPPVERLGGGGRTGTPGGGDPITNAEPGTAPARPGRSGDEAPTQGMKLPNHGETTAPAPKAAKYKGPRTR